MASTTLRKVKVTASIPGQSNPIIASVDLSSGVNNFPRMDLAIYPNEGKSPKTPTSAEVAQTVAELQTHMFSSASKANLSVKVEDGNGGSVDFKGYLNDVSYNLGFGSIGYGITSTHEVALLSSLKTSIYSAETIYEGFREDLEIAGSLSSIFKTILEKTVELFTQALDTLYDTDRALRNSIDGDQKTALDLWYKILENSADTTTYKSLDELTKTDFFIKESIQKLIRSVYLNSSADFMQTVLMLCNNFQLIFVPDMVNGNHRLIKSGDIVAEAGKYTPKSTPIIQLQFSTGNKGGLPLQGVICRNLPQPNLGHSLNSPSAAYYPGSLPVSCAWPAKIESGGGLLLETSLPNWLPLMTPVVFEEGTIESATSPKYELGQLYSADSNAIIQANNFTNGALTAIVQEHLRGQYVNFALGSSAATVIIPLDLTWKIGELYNVVHEQGGVLFRGFLSSVRHKLELRGKEASCGTTLNFTHIQAGDFVLPNLS